MKPPFTPLHDVLLGMIGTAAPLFGVIASWQQHLEWGLRIASLLVGIAVGVATLVSLYRRSK